MKKHIQVFLLLVLSGLIASAQTTATDFTVNDCSGASHHLFAELDAGKIIVMAMVDPCGSCVGPSKSALTIVNSFATSNPGRVLYYLVDDVGNTTCANLTSWGASSSITNVVTISNSAVNQNSYGGPAMPKIVVVAGTDHKIYFKQDNALTSSNLTTAINAALGATGVAEKKFNLQLSVFPNPAVDKLTIDYTLNQASEVTFEVYNLLGTKVRTINAGKQSSGDQKMSIDFENLSNGVYFLKLTAGEYTQIMKFTIAR